MNGSQDRKNFPSPKGGNIVIRIWMQSFWEVLKSLLLYHQMVLRLILRGGLPPDFARVMAVKGQTRRSEVRCLYELAKGAPKEGVIVEIGSYRGLSTIALARGSLLGPQAPVYTIDPHEISAGPLYGPQNNVAFFRNVLFAGVADLVRPISLLSTEAGSGWEKPIGLLWIDGNHEYEAVKRDFVEWSKFVVEGGYLAFHDSKEPDGGPFQAVQEALQEGTFKFVKRVEKVSVLRKGKSG